ncbi:MAG: hypothetical protein V1778_02830, partial [bacterium]
MKQSRVAIEHNRIYRFTEMMPVVLASANGTDVDAVFAVNVVIPDNRETESSRSTLSIVQLPGIRDEHGMLKFIHQNPALPPQSLRIVEQMTGGILYRTVEMNSDAPANPYPPPRLKKEAPWIQYTTRLVAARE